MIRLLLLAQEGSISDLIAPILRDLEVQAESVVEIDSAREVLKSGGLAAVVVHLTAAGALTSVDLEALHAADPVLPLVVLSEPSEHDVALQTVKRLPVDWIPLPADPSRLRLGLEVALRSRQLSDQLQDQLQRQAAALKDALHFKTSVIKTITHDFQNVLMGVMGFAQLAQMTDDAVEKDRNLEDVVTTARTLRAMMDNVSVFARADHIELNTQTILLDAAVHDVLGGSPGTPAWQFESDVGHCTVRADPRHLRQVLRQLLDNAMRYSPAGTSIMVRARTRGTQVRVTVEDRGIGIPLEMQRLLFEPFYRAKRPDTAEIPGAGLGLAIVRLLIDRMGGAAGIESQVGHGTLAWFTLPAAPTD